MKIAMVNKTHWRSDQLKAFIARAMKDERPDLCKRGAPALKVTVVYTRGRGCGYSSGYAYYRSNVMRIRLSKHIPDKVDLAFVITHELAHTRGLSHDRMNCPTYNRVGRWREIYAWGATMPLDPTEKKVKVVTTDDRLVHAQRMLKSAMTREKRAVTLRKKWQTKVKYYTKRAAVAAPQEENHA